MYFFHRSNENENYLVQHRKNDKGEWYWDIKDYWNNPIDDYDLMNSLGLSLGISVGQLIKYYVED